MTASLTSHEMSLINGRFESVANITVTSCTANPPADDMLGIGSNDERHICKAPPNGTGGEIGDPNRIRRRHLELPVQFVQQEMEPLFGAIVSWGLVTDDAPNRYGSVGNHQLK